MKEPIDDRGPLPQKGKANPARLSFKWGLIGAASAVTGAVILATLHGLFLGFHPSPIYGSYEAGWNAAHTMAIFVFFMGGLPIAGFGFAIGFVVGLVKSAFGKGG
jgi:hypothetical protein